MTWDPLTQPQDYATFMKRYRTPGLCEILNASSLRRWDVPEGFGFAGADMKYTGLKVAKFSVQLTLLTVDDWSDWEVFRRAVLSPPLRRYQRGNRAAMDIDHPVLASVGIASYVVEEVLAPEQVDNSVWQIEIKCIEWRKVAPALLRAKGPAATPDDPPNPDQLTLADVKRVGDLLAKELESL